MFVPCCSACLQRNGFAADLLRMNAECTLENFLNAPTEEYRSSSLVLLTWSMSRACSLG